MAFGVLVLVGIAAFLLGSIPSGVLIGKLVYGVDIREHGSGNIGTTNAVRSLGKKGGALVFLLDFGKGLLAGLLAVGLVKLLVPAAQLGSSRFPSYPIYTALAFFAAISGHIFSPWLGFKGGKGIAVAVGCLFVTFGPLGACIELLLFALIVAATRYVSAGSIAAALLCPFLAGYYFIIHGGTDVVSWLLCSAGALLVLWAHRGNFQRLRTGTERRIGTSKEV